MNQAVAAHIGHCSRAAAAMALLLLRAMGSPDSQAAAHAVADGPSRPVGLVEQPCPAAPAPESAGGDAHTWQERVLDPGAGNDVEALYGRPPAAASSHADDEHLRNDWAGLCHYRAENAALRKPTAPRVVFLGDSITELWKAAHPDFFGDNFVDRGISGQTTGQMLLRFRQDVISLKPAVVHILGGTNDIAGNGGPTTLDAIKSNIASMVDLAIANDIRVVIGSVPPAGAFPWRPGIMDPAEHIVELNDWLRRYAHERNLPYVDYHEPLADERDAMKQTFSNDGVHPNRDGYGVMEPLARAAIDKAISAANTAGSKPVPAKPGRPGKSSG